MKIGYFGTPEHSARLLSALIQAGYEISFVITNMDKPIGREKLVKPTPVKKIALENQIPVLQFPRLKELSAVKEVLTYQADIHIIFAYGQIIPKEIFSAPKLGALNLHGSLLPEFRGASPVQTAILFGKTKTGSTIQYITEELDAGDIVKVTEVEITLEDNFATLLDKITNAGIRDFLDLLKNANGEKFIAIPQDHAKASFCKKIQATDRKLDFSEKVISIHNRVRAFNPGNICFTGFRGKRLNIYRTKVPEPPIQTQLSTGSIWLEEKKKLGVVCENGEVLLLEEVQPENKKVMTALEFKNGHRIESGERFQ